MATFSRSERKRRPRDNKSAELTSHLRQAMTTAIKTDLYPKSRIDVFVQVSGTGERPDLAGRFFQIVFLPSRFDEYS